MTKIYRFWIPYLGIYVTLSETEFNILRDYAEGKIGYTEYYRKIYPVIRKFVPRGYRMSVLMYIVRLYETGNYEEVTEESCLRIYLEWHVKTKYIKRHHEFITEGYASIELYIPETYYELHKTEILNTLNEKLFSAYVYGLTREYFYVAEEEYYDFEKAYVIEIYRTEKSKCIDGKLLDFAVGISRKEDAEIRIDRDLSARMFKYIDDAVKEFVDELKSIIGGE